MPSAYRDSARAENTGSRSCSSIRRSAFVQSRLSAPASAPIVSQMSAVEVCNGLDRPVDLLVPVGERDQHRLELARRNVDPALEQVAEERRVAVGVAALRVL